MLGAVTASLEGGGGGGGGATRVVAGAKFFEIGGEGGRAMGALNARLITGLCCVSLRQSCDWCNEDGVGARTGGERGSRML